MITNNGTKYGRAAAVDVTLKVTGTCAACSLLRPRFLTSACNFVALLNLVLTNTARFVALILNHLVKNVFANFHTKHGLIQCNFTGILAF